MVQQNGNKQHFTINSATPSNPANRTLESIYHTFKFVSSVRPDVNLDVHPCGLDRICKHPCATKITQRLTEWCAYAPQQLLTIVVLCRIHALMMVSNAWVQRSATGVPDYRLRPTKTHVVACNLLQLHFHLLKQLSSTATTLPCSPLPTTIKISCQE